MSENASNEVWKDVEGQPGYQISDRGRVRTCRNRSGWGLTKDYRPVKTWITRYGYAEVSFTIRGQEHRVRRFVHRLVLEAFVGPRPSTTHCTRHLNGNRLDNRVENLAWGTQQENANDRLLHGTVPRGKQCWKARLTDEKVAEMKRLYREGWRQCDLARRFNQTRENVFKVLSGQTWSHVIS